MRFICTLFLALAVAAAGAMAPAHAGASDPLFIHLSTDDAHRAALGLNFGLHQQQSGHALTVFLNDRAVLLATRVHAERHAAQQRVLVELMQQGATVLVAPLSMHHYGVSEADLLPGMVVSNRKLSGAALFRDQTRTLSW